MREVREPAGTPGGSGDLPAERVLAAAYPDGRERDRAIGWLVWIAGQMGAGRNLAWWQIPDWIGEAGLRAARTLTGAVLLGVAFGLGFGGYLGVRGLAAGLVAALAAGWIGNRVRPGKLRRARTPQALVPQWPRSVRHRVVLALALVTGLFLRRTLIFLWARPVAAWPPADPVGYRACRRSTVIDAAACLATGLPWCVAGLGLGTPELTAAGAALAGFAVLTALADGKLPALKQAELTLLVRRRRRVSFRRLLDGAVDRRVLVAAAGYYRFRDPSVQDYLLGRCQAAADERQRRMAARKHRAALRAERIAAAAAGKHGVRPWLLGWVSPERRLIRLAVDAGCGAGLATIGRLLSSRLPGWHSASGAVFGSLGVLVAGLALFVAGALLAGLVLDRLAWGLRWSLWLTGRTPPAGRVAAGAVSVAAAGGLTWLAGPAAVRHGIGVTAVAVMPAVTVAAVGGWAAVLVHRRCRGARRRALRYGGDAVAVAVAAVAILLLVDRNLLGAQAAAGLLFPVAVWLSVVGWRAMNDAGHAAVRAAADIVVSLMLGSTLVLLLVWLANLLHMPRAEVRVLRGALGRAGAVTDLPWWVWTALYLVLAAASLAFAVWPGRLGRVTGWFARLRVVPSVTVTSRVTSGVHIGLLVVLLIGLAGPAAVEPALRARLADRYTETLTGTLRARGELAAYRAVTRAFTLGELPVVVPLADLVLQIDRTSEPARGHDGATSVELDLARRLGELQAVTFAPRPPDIARAAAAATGRAGFPGPAPGRQEESRRLARLDSAEKQDDATGRLADQAAELAASAVARALQLPGLGNTEVVQVIKEYLSGLIENSPVKDVFAAWAGRIAGGHPPGPAAGLVIPDPERLKDAAAAAASSEVAARPVTDPGAVGRFLGETAVVAAVDLANQVRYLQEGDGPCHGCARPEPPADRRGPGPEDHPVRPPEFIP